MRKYSFYLRIILLCSLCSVCKDCIAQKQGLAKIDSLMTVLKNYRSPCNYGCIIDSSKVNCLITLSNELCDRNPDTSLLLSKEALTLSDKIKWGVGIGKSSNAIGYVYFVKGDYLSSLSFYTKSLQVWNQLEKPSVKSIKSYNSSFIENERSKTYTNIGSIYQAQGKYTEAIEIYLGALKIDEDLGNKKGISVDLGNIGVVYYLQGNYVKALEYLLKSLELDKRLGDKHDIASDLANIGSVYMAQGDYSNAIEFQLNSLKINEELGNKHGVGGLLNNIGGIYVAQQKLSKALDCFLKGLKISQELGYKDMQATCLANLGVVYTQMKDYTNALYFFSRALQINKELKSKPGIADILGNIGAIYDEQKQYEKAQKYYYDALEISEEIGDSSNMAVNWGNIGAIFTKTKRYLPAEKYLKKSLVVYERIGAKNEIRKFSEKLSELYEHTGRHKSALEYYKKASALKDSLFNNEKDKEIFQKTIAYEQEKKDVVAKAEQDRKEALAKEELSKQKLLRNAIALGAGMVLLSSLIIFFFYKRKREAVYQQKETSLNLQVSETEMKALRSQMNPHFIFNALQSIQTFLLSHKSEEANEYLLKFSKLMRLVLENSQHSEVPLKEDMQALDLYMQLESIRLQHPFTYQFHIDSSVDVENDSIPPLILQPFVENAIWHGLQYKPEPGHIDIYISNKDNALYATVEDNGVGRDMSKQVAQPMLLKKESLGMKLTEERLKILNEFRKIKARFSITDLFTSDNQPAGTKVELSLPLAP